MPDGLVDVRLDPALIVGRVGAESPLRLFLGRLSAAVLAAGLMGAVVGSVISNADGRYAGSWAGWSSFVLLSLVLYWRCDAQAVTRYLPEVLGRRSRTRIAIPVRHDHVPLQEVRPGQWIAPSNKYLHDLKRAEAKAAQKGSAVR